MNEISQTAKVNAVFVVKNEWPFLAVSISHALTHYAQKVLVIDTGSIDGTFRGVRVLQSLWGGRVELYRCNQEVYDQTPLTNLLLEISSSHQAEWTMVLDADEFFVHENYVDFLTKLSQTEDHWRSYAIRVSNFIVGEDHDDSRLKAFENITYQINGQPLSHNSDEEYTRQVLCGEIPLQTRITADKILVRNSKDNFLAQGAHQVVFGDGKLWERHDTTVASGSYLGGIICHLPYTGQSRLEYRKTRNFFDQQDTTYRLSVNELKNQPISELRSKAVLSSENKERWLQSGVIIENSEFRKTLLPVIEKIEVMWPEVILASYNPEDEHSFPDSLDIRLVSRLIRRYHSRAERLWAGSIN